MKTSEGISTVEINNFNKDFIKGKVMKEFGKLNTQLKRAMERTLQEWSELEITKSVSFQFQKTRIENDKLEFQKLKEKIIQQISDSNVHYPNEVQSFISQFNKYEKRLTQLGDDILSRLEQAESLRNNNIGSEATDTGLRQINLNQQNLNQLPFVAINGDLIGFVNKFLTDNNIELERQERILLLDLGDNPSRLMNAKITQLFNLQQRIQGNASFSSFALGQKLQHKIDEVRENISRAEGLDTTMPSYKINKQVPQEIRSVLDLLIPITQAKKVKGLKFFNLNELENVDNLDMCIHWLNNNTKGIKKDNASVIDKEVLSVLRGIDESMGSEFKEGLDEAKTRLGLYVKSVKDSAFVLSPRR